MSAPAETTYARQPVGGQAGELSPPPSSPALLRWRLHDAIGRSLELEHDLRIAGAVADADVIRRMRGRLRAMRDGHAVVDPNGRLCDAG